MSPVGDNAVRSCRAGFPGQQALPHSRPSHPYLDNSIVTLRSVEVEDELVEFPLSA